MLLRPGRCRAGAAAAQAELAEDEDAAWGRVFPPGGTGHWPSAAYRLPVSQMPEYGRMLGAWHGDADYPGKRVHAIMRVLQYRDRPAADAGPGRTAEGRRCRADHEAAPC